MPRFDLYAVHLNVHRNVVPLEAVHLDRSEILYPSTAQPSRQSQGNPKDSTTEFLWLPVLTVRETHSQGQFQDHPPFNF